MCDEVIRKNNSYAILLRSFVRDIPLIKWTVTWDVNVSRAIWKTNRKGRRDRSAKKASVGSPIQQHILWVQHTSIPEKRRTVENIKRIINRKTKYNLNDAINSNEAIIAKKHIEFWRKKTHLKKISNSIYVIFAINNSHKSLNRNPIIKKCIVF